MAATGAGGWGLGAGVMPTYHFRWILILLLFLAWGLRVVDIDRDSLWLDEGLTPERSGYTIPKILANEVDIQGFPTQDTHPPFYYLVIKGTRAVFGTSDFAYRFPSAIFGLLLIAVMAKLGALLGGKPTALVAALITALSPFQIAYSQEARMYTLLMLLVAVGLLALLEGERGKGKGKSGHSLTANRYLLNVLCRHASYSNIDPETAALSDSTLPRWGISTIKSQFWRTL